jgi:serine/threonine protein kinase
MSDETSRRVAAEGSAAKEPARDAEPKVDVDVGVDTENEDEDDEPPLSTGSFLGRYELVGKLGAGGMSVVYLAYDPNLDRKIALKLMRTKSVGADASRRLQREAQALAKLSHPNVVPVYDVGAVGGQAFVAMEYVEGQTLRAWLKEKRSWREVLETMIEAGRGLAAAHAAGLVHRDFKPDNVLIGNDGRVRVLDFGLARLASMLDGTESPSTPSLPPSGPASASFSPLSENVESLLSASPSASASSSVPPTSARSSLSTGPSSGPGVALTRADQIVGTPAYMAPEQLRRGPVDERADQFSFAVTLYDALFRERPFPDLEKKLAGSSARTVTLTTDTLDARTLGQPTPPRRSRVPRWVQRAILRALSFEPGARFATMDALLVALSTDPYRVWRRAAFASMTVIAVVLVGFALVRAGARDKTMCRGGGGRAAAVWGGAAKDDVRRAFGATGAPYQGAAMVSVASALDAYAASWAQMSDEACSATRLRGEQSEEVLDLRMVCLGSRLREMDAMVDALRHADEDTVKKAAKAARSLVPLEECNDVAALRAPSPRPRDPEVAARVDAIEGQLAVVETEIALGKDKEALTLADRLVPDAQKAAFGPLLARALFWRGRAAANLNDNKISIPSLRDAFAAALASREERVLKDSAARIAQEYIYAYDVGEYEYWAKVAQAAIDRGAPDPTLQSFVDHTRCVGLWQPGRMRARLDCLERHAAKVEKTRPLDDWELTTLGLAASDAGEFARGVDYTRRGYAFALAQNGALHPRTLEMRGYVCKALLDFGDVGGALAECTEAVHVAESVSADNGYVIGKIRMYWGASLRQAGRYDEARVELDLARPHVDVSEVEGEVAQLEMASGHADQAVATLRKSLEAAAKDLPPGHPNVVGSKLSLGEALLDVNAVAEAEKVLDDALMTSAAADISPLLIADVEFAAARARLRGDPKSASKKREALELARRARDTYDASAPQSKRYEAERARIDNWLAEFGKTAAP